MRTMGGRMSLHDARELATADAVELVVVTCLACQEACIQCADACSSDCWSHTLTRGIRLSRDCAASCGELARALGQCEDEKELRVHVEECASACATCGADCQNKARRHGCCRIAADACLSCEEACRALLRQWQPTQPAQPV